VTERLSAPAYIVEGWVMDINELLYRQQVSLMQAAAAACASARLSHIGLARGYAKRIEGIRQSMGVSDSSLKLL
jgi:hypothetical protein